MLLENGQWKENLWKIKQQSSKELLLNICKEFKIKMLKLYLQEHKAVWHYFKIWGGGLEGQDFLKIVAYTKAYDKNQSHKAKIWERKKQL